MSPLPLGCSRGGILLYPTLPDGTDMVDELGHYGRTAPGECCEMGSESCSVVRWECGARMAGRNCVCTCVCVHA